ncbi:unnamed protein product [Paramecium octaurelia]|uniref:Sperm-tail PG-rich repeat protein n=1 Tax=Paramecium octaurelia TaxID=43137 RepID=A0A8S1XI29_PAROT|nr:unnamed protein product [Paramecium octaurelia]
MAFIYYSRVVFHKTYDEIEKLQIGPGSYITHEYYKVKQGNAPFDSSVSRSERNKNENIPGPGSYYQDNEYDNITYGRQHSPKQMKLSDKQQQSFIFASSSKRFEAPKVFMTPGPGAYETDVVINKPIQQQFTSQNYMEILRSLNKYQSIPSIPTDNQVYGYTEKGVHDLESNQNPDDTYSGIKQDTVGPGKYEIKDTFEQNRNKGPCWHKSKIPRFDPSISKDMNQKVGPGSYNYSNSITPIYKLSPSGNFKSKSSRTFDNTKGEKQKQFMKIYFDKQKEKLMRNPGYSDLEDEEFELSDITTPGPGHYFGNTSTQSVSSKHSQQSIKLGYNCFGSRSKRFQEQKVQYQIGPGEYQLDTETVKYNIVQPPFYSSNTRFEEKFLGQLPGPQTYDPKITLADKLMKKLERTPIGNFGINESRYKEEYHQVPGPGTYEINNKVQKGINSIFKSKTDRNNSLKQKTDNFPAPGTYNVQINTIQHEIKKNHEENQEIKQQKQAFGSSMPRFISRKNIQERVQQEFEEEEEEEEEIQKLHNSSGLFKKSKNVQASFNVRENRFQTKKKDTYKLGPGEYYSPNSSKWEKTSFNILFQKI